MTQKSPKEEIRIKSVETSFTIVEAVTELGGATVGELADHLEMSQSTVYYHAKTLADLGYLQKEGNEYDTGIKFLVHGGYSRKNMRMYEISRDEVDDLAEKYNVVASTIVEESGRRLILYRNEGEKAVYNHSPVGHHENMHQTSSGKAILAHLPEEYKDEIVEMHGLPATTEHTITEREELDKELERVREQGYAVGDEENVVGLKAIAVPVIPEDTVVGAIAIAGPKKRLPDEEVPEIANDIESAANAIELRYLQR